MHVSCALCWVCRSFIRLLLESASTRGRIMSSGESRNGSRYYKIDQLQQRLTVNQHPDMHTRYWQVKLSVVFAVLILT